MNNFKATSPTGEIFEYSALVPNLEHLTAGWHCEQIILVESGLVPEEVAQPIVKVEKVMTKLEYLRRFTQNERITIRTVAATNPVLADYMALLELASEIDTNDPDTISAVNMLEASGLLASGRAEEILYA